MKRLVPITEVVDIKNSRVKSFSGKRRYLATGDLAGDEVNDFVYVEYKTRPSRADLLVNKGDIIVARMQATKKVLQIDRANEDLIVSTGFLILVPREGFDVEYLTYYFKSGIFQRQKDRYCTGATQRAINNTAFRKLQIPIYPLEEQKKIAQILSKADFIRQKRIQSFEYLDEFLKAVFYEMFGDPALNQKGFKLIKLNQAFSKKKIGTKCGPFGSALKKHEYVEAGIPVWTMENIKENEFIPTGCLFITEEKSRTLEAYNVENGDIIISRAGTVGRMCVINTDAEKSIISTNLIRLSLDSNILEPEFFTFLMSNFPGRVGRLKTGADGAYTFMNTGVLNNLELFFPPIELQRTFLRISKKIREIKDNMRHSFSEMDNQVNALEQTYFRYV